MTVLEHASGCRRPFLVYLVRAGWLWTSCRTCGSHNVTRTGTEHHV